MSGMLGPEEDAFVRAHSRTFLLGTRADGAPTGWPMVGLYAGDGLEFSTYGTSQKVRDFARDPRACCVVAPADGERALVMRGTCTVADGRTELPRVAAADAPTSATVDEAIAARAQARMRSGKRVVLRFVGTSAWFVPGYRAGA